MEFFEFFFSGPSWGWKLVGLLCFISTVGDALASIIKALVNRNLKRTKDVQLEATNPGATKDDVRS